MLVGLVRTRLRQSPAVKYLNRAHDNAEKSRLAT